MSTTIQENRDAHASTSSIPPQLEAFENIAGYLRESAVGVYAGTLSPTVMEASRVCTLWAVSNAIQNTGCGLSASREDIVSSRMAMTAYWLSGRTQLNVGGPHAIPLHATDVDSNIWKIQDLSIIPSRARVDAGSMRAYIHAIAAQWAADASAGELILSLARATGSMLWLRAASMLVQAGEC
jgi:hypothetical protein